MSDEYSIAIALTNIEALAEAKEELEKEVRTRANRVTSALFSLKNNNGRQEAFAALQKRGFHDGDTESWAGSVEIETHNRQLCAKITSTAYACQNHWEGHLYVPVEVFDGGPERFEEWLREIVAAAEVQKAEEAAARARQQEERDRRLFEQLRERFENPGTEGA
jgi:hypothetical protein